MDRMIDTNEELALLCADRDRAVAESVTLRKQLADAREKIDQFHSVAIERGGGDTWWTYCPACSWEATKRVRVCAEPLVARSWPDSTILVRLHRPDAEVVVHLCPEGDGDRTQCCGRSVMEMAVTQVRERITTTPGMVTCTGKTAR